MKDTCVYVYIFGEIEPQMEITPKTIIKNVMNKINGKKDLCG